MSPHSPSLLNILSGSMSNSTLSNCTQATRERQRQRVGEIIYKVLIEFTSKQVKIIHVGHFVLHLYQHSKTSSNQTPCNFTFFSLVFVCKVLLVSTVLTEINKTPSQLEHCWVHSEYKYNIYLRKGKPKQPKKNTINLSIFSRVHRDLGLEVSLYSREGSTVYYIFLNKDSKHCVFLTIN